MHYNTILFEERDGAFRLTLNRPERLNSFTAIMHAEIVDALDHAGKAAPRVLLITGAGRGFCAGQDLGERDVSAGPLDLGANLEAMYNPLLRRLADFPCPIVCAVNGVAAGSGVSIALACDLTIATQSAKFTQAFSSIGLVPDAGGTWNLPRRVGLARALGFTLMGESLRADEAAAIGMIWQSVPDAEFAQRVEAVIERLAHGPTAGLTAARNAIRAAMTSDLDTALDRERDLQCGCGRTADYAEGVSAFKQKRRPAFSGR